MIHTRNFCITRCWSRLFSENILGICAFSQHPRKCNVVMVWGDETFRHRGYSPATLLSPTLLPRCFFVSSVTLLSENKPQSSTKRVAKHFSIFWHPKIIKANSFSNPVSATLVTMIRFNILFRFELSRPKWFRSISGTCAQSRSHRLWSGYLPSFTKLHSTSRVPKGVSKTFLWQHI